MSLKSFAKSVIGGVAKVGGAVTSVVKDLNIPVVSGVAGLANKGLNIVGSMVANTSTAVKDIKSGIADLKKQVVNNNGTKASNTAGMSVVTTDTSTGVGTVNYFALAWNWLVAKYTALPVWLKWLLGGSIVLFVWWLLVGRKKRRKGSFSRKRVSVRRSVPIKRRSSKKSTLKSEFVKRMAAGRRRAAKKRRRA